jgi:hypothetical protein
MLIMRHCNNDINGKQSGNILLVCFCLLFSTQTKAALLDSLYEVFGGAGKSACYIAADGLALVPVPVCSLNDTLSSPTDLFCRFTRSHCDNAYLQGEQITNTVSECLDNAVNCSQQAVEEACDLTSGLCEQAEGLVNDVITTTEQCLQNIPDCPEQVMQQLNADAVRLAGRIVDESNQPMMGIMVSAVPETDNVLQATTSTHIAITDGNGHWQMEINPAFSYSGQYRVIAMGPLHKFVAINNSPLFNYLVTVE